MEEESAMAKHIVLDGLPKNIIPAKQEIFRKFFFGQIQKQLGHDNFVIHFTIDDETGLVSGAFLTFVKVADAERALALLNRFQISKTDIVQTYRWSALKEIREDPGEYKVPEYQPEIATDSSNAMMEDPLARPMFLLKSGQHFDPELYWYDNAAKTTELFMKPNSSRSDHLGLMTEMDRRAKKAQTGLIFGVNREPKPLPIWTPLGTMLVSQHHTGLKFWGGKQFALLFEVEENNILAFTISPQEKFLIVKTDREVTVWNLKQNKKVKVLSGFDPEKWPVAKFNADDTLVAFCKDEKLRVYDTATMQLIQGSDEPRSFTLELADLKDFEWSPMNHRQIAFVFSENLHQGWKVTIEDFNVSEGTVTMHNHIRQNFLGAQRIDVLWHPEGAGLAAKITKEEKAGEEAVEYCLFRITSKSVTADHFKIEKHFIPHRFAWQPGGKYFALILIDRLSAATVTATGPKMVMRFYAVDSKLGIKMVGTFATAATNLLWAPKGTRLVGANYEKSLLEFYGINDSGVAVALERAEHPTVSDTQWEPTGRFFASWNSVIRCPESNRLRIWDMNGRRLLEKKIDKLSHLAWRPLAKNVLTPDEVNEVRANLKAISAQYDAEDRRVKDEIAAKERAKVEAVEESYIKTMDAIAAEQRRLGYAETRAALRRSAPMAIRQQQFLDELPEDKKMVDETVTETRVKSREELKQQATLASVAR